VIHTGHGTTTPDGGRMRRSTSTKLTIAAFIFLSPLHARAEEAAAQGPPSAAETRYELKTLPQPLGAALQEFAEQSGIQIIFFSRFTDGLDAPALNGAYTSESALRALLQGTDLTFRQIDAKTIQVEPKSSVRKRTDTTSSAAALEEVVVLGSLLPATQSETASAITRISSEDMKARGFSNAADALQNLTLNTGGVLNTSINQGDVWGAKTLSLFGLPANFTKFMIDGRPMPNFSQLQQTTNTDVLITNLSGIPIDMIDHVEIMPGGGSSLYGSDAMAGVVNIVLKKNVQFATLNAGYGWYTGGGGETRRVSFNDSFHLGALNLTLGAQISDQQPIWAYQRSITAQNFAGGVSPQPASEVASVFGYFTGNYYSDASQCKQLAGLWGGSVQQVQTSGGSYCGSSRSGGYQTLTNKERGGSLTAHATYDLNDRLQLYADLYDSYQEQAHSVNTIASSFYYDPNLQDLVSLQRYFAPEEIGYSLNDSLLQKNYENTGSLTLGGKAQLGRGWNLDINLTRSQERIDDRETGLLSNGFTAQFLGPQLDSFSGFQSYAPSNYAALYVPLTPAQMSAYLGTASIASSSRNDLARTQLSQQSLFALPGGDAGLALVAERGFESWDYLPPPALYTQTSTGVTSEIEGLAWQPSGGHRSRYAGAAELNLPLVKMLTVDLSGRYDRYDAEGAVFSHATYGVGVEFRPVETLLLRGKFGTSFKAPDLIDEFEGSTTRVGRYGVDYLNCAKLGFTGENLGQCPIQRQQTPITWKELSNPNLESLTSTSWSYGFVYAPLPTVSLNVDYQHIDIKGEVLKESPTYLLQNELYCANGTLPANSPSCQEVAQQIIRAPATPGSQLLGPFLEVDTRKINRASEANNSISANSRFEFDLVRFGSLTLDTAYTVVLNHTQQNFSGDPTFDLLSQSQYANGFKSKINAGLTWRSRGWSATVFGTRYGKTPNYAAFVEGNDAPGAGKLPPWVIYNASLSYSPLAPLQLSLRVNNLTNAMPPFDRTQNGNFNTPFNAQNYNPYGRSMLLEVQYRFGRVTSK